MWYNQYMNQYIDHHYYTIDDDSEFTITLRPAIGWFDPLERYVSAQQVINNRYVYMSENDGAIVMAKLNSISSYVNRLVSEMEQANQIAVTLPSPLAYISKHHGYLTTWTGLDEKYIIDGNKLKLRSTCTANREREYVNTDDAKYLVQLTNQWLSRSFNTKVVISDAELDYEEAVHVCKHLVKDIAKLHTSGSDTMTLVRLSKLWDNPSLVNKDTK